MKKLFCVLMLLSVLLFTVSCKEIPSQLERNTTGTKETQSTVSDGPATGETDASESTTEKANAADKATDESTTEKSDGSATESDGIHNAGEDTDSGWGPLHPIGGN